MIKVVISHARPALRHCGFRSTLKILREEIGKGPIGLKIQFPNLDSKISPNRYVNAPTDDRIAKVKWSSDAPDQIGFALANMQCADCMTGLSIILPSSATAPRVLLLAAMTFSAHAISLAVGINAEATGTI